MNAKIIMAAGLLALSVACGGSSKSGAPAVATLSCSLPAGGICLSVTAPPAGFDSAGFNSACSTNGGTPGTGCPAASQVGKCRLPGGPPDMIVVYYSPAFTAGTAQADCLAPPAGTWIP